MWGMARLVRHPTPLPLPSTTSDHLQPTQPPQPNSSVPQKDKIHTYIDYKDNKSYTDYKDKAFSQAV